MGPSILRSILPNLLQRCFTLGPTILPVSILPSRRLPGPSFAETYFTTLRVSHFPAPCLTVTRERRVSERNHPYNCWGVTPAGASSRKRDDVGWVWGLKGEPRWERGWKRLTRYAVVSSARGKGRLELTPSYFRMEELAGVFLLFVSGTRLPTLAETRFLRTPRSSTNNSCPREISPRDTPRVVASFLLLPLVPDVRVYVNDGVLRRKSKS